jgi:hypothetical protein
MGKGVHIFRTDNKFFLIADKSYLTTVLNVSRKYSWEHERPYRSNEHNVLHCEHAVKRNYKRALIFRSSTSCANFTYIT